MKNKEELYLKAKDAYYNNEPIMDDSAFDELEAQLRAEGSSVIKIVGSFDRKAKHKHPTKMGSLAKIQADKTTGDAPKEEFIKWLTDVKATYGSEEAILILEVSQKLDGNALNLIYVDGELKQGLSRGDGVLGRDYLNKLDKTQIPFIIPMKGVVEIRCEAVVEKKVFAEKYAYLSDLTDEENKKLGKSKNERNFVAGVLNSDDVNAELMSDIHIVPVSCHLTNNNDVVEYYDIDTIKDWGFKYYNKLELGTISGNGMLENGVITSPEVLFERVFIGYNDFKHNTSSYRIDGFVIKCKAKYRSVIGETDHHPKWAIAVKFKPEDCVTTVKGVEWQMGKTGNFTPVLLLDPVDLDGSVVSKASGYNYKYVIDNNIKIGSVVKLVKSGDIIPQIMCVIS